MPDLEFELKKLIVDVLELEDVSPGDIGSDEPLFGDGLGLDSIDGLELGMAIRKTYGVKIEATNEDVRTIFTSVRTLANFISGQKGAV